MINFLLYSNLYLACGASIIAYVTTVTIGETLTWEVLFFPFTGTFLIYTLNRYSDKNEDRINVPIRVQFIERYGKLFLATSIIIYCVAIAIAFTKGIVVLVLLVLPLSIGILYSYIGFKKIIIGKNLLVGVAWAITVLLTGAFYNNFTIKIWLLFAFFSIILTVNAVIFDVKDIKGDLYHGIITIPVLLGIKFTRYLCYALNGLALMVIALGVTFRWLPLSALLLCTQVVYTLVYTYLCNEKRGRLYFDLFIDGEFMALLVAYLAFAFLQKSTY